MKLFFLILVTIHLTQLNVATAGTILKTQKIDIAGEHGMSIKSKNTAILADTFKSKDTSASWLFQVSGNKLTKINFAGIGLAGVTAIPTGYLICDLLGSAVYKTNKSFKIQNQWVVENPWVAKSDKDGNIFALTNGGQFLLLKPTGESELKITGLDAPFDFEFTNDKNSIWISEQGQKDGRVSLWKLNSDKKLTRTLDSNFKWKNPEGLLFFKETLWALDTELGELVQVQKEGSSKSVLKDLGIPILIKEQAGKIWVYTNEFQGGPALVQIKP